MGGMTPKANWNSYVLRFFVRVQGCLNEGALVCFLRSNSTLAACADDSGQPSLGFVVLFGG